MHFHLILLGLYFYCVTAISPRTGSVFKPSTGVSHKSLPQKIKAKILPDKPSPGPKIVAIETFHKKVKLENEIKNLKHQKHELKKLNPKANPERQKVKEDLEKLLDEYEKFTGEKFKFPAKEKSKPKVKAGNQKTMIDLEEMMRARFKMQK